MKEKFAYLVEGGGFQFQDGSIKWLIQLQTGDAYSEFQFQDGSIKCL